MTTHAVDATRPRIAVVITRSTAPLDFDAWAAQYVRAVIAAYRAAQPKLAEAA